MWRVLRLLCVMLLLAAVGAGAAAGYLWFRSDEILTAELQKYARAHLAGASIAIGRAHFDLSGRVRVYDLKLRLQGESLPALVIPETIITLDRQRFADHQRILVQQIQLRQPQVRIVRDGSGRFAWQRVRWTSDDPAGLLPDVDVAHAHVDFVTATGSATPALRFPIEDIQVQLRPASRNRYAVQVAARTDVTGVVNLQGQLPLESAAWSLTGEVQELRVDPATLELAVLLAPPLARHLDAAQTALASRAPVQLVSARSPRSTGPRYDFGVSAVAKVRVRLAAAAAEDPPQFQVEAQVKSGRITHSALPFALSDLQGLIKIDPTQILLQNLQGAFGDRKVTVNARREASGRVAGTLQAENVPIDEALMARLPATLQRHVRALALTGLVSGTVTYSSLDGQKWTLDADATLTDGTVRHEKFPLLVQSITATLGWHDNLMQIEGQGRHGINLVKVVGTIHNPGPAGDVDFHVQANDFALDDEIIRACPEGLQNTIAALNLAGRGSARLRVQRPPGLNQKYVTQVWAAAHKASLLYDGFRYPITDLTGEVSWLGDVVTFDKLHGYHDGAELVGSGSYVLSEPGRLNLSVAAKDAAFDRALYAAVPKSVRDAWDALSPQGLFSVWTEIDWQPGSDVQVVIPKMTVHRGELELIDFPFPWRDVRAELAYAEGRVDIREFSAWHDELQVGGQGAALCPVDQPWRVTFDKFFVDDLTLTPALRRALPLGLRPVVDALNPRGRFSSTGPVTFFGPSRPGDMIGATWDLTVQLTGCSINAGLLLTDMYGHVQLKGRFDGIDTQLQGTMDLESLGVLGNHQITKIRGPLKYENLQLEVGSKEMTVPPRGDEVPRITAASRVHAQAYDGELTLDAFLDLRAEPTYRAHLELTGASLEKYALRHLRGQGNVRGLMNGWMDIRGRGLTFDGVGGEGRLQISPAALYELPVFLQMFQLPQFAPIDRTAFNYADFFFTIANQRFDFQAIDLVGKTISLRGRGHVRFDGQVNLNFFTMLPRNRTPVLGSVVDLLGMVSQGWIAVEVRGPMASPTALVVPFPAVDDALRQFLSAFDGRPAGPQPPPQWRGPPRSSDAGSQLPR